MKIFFILVSLICVTILSVWGHDYFIRSKKIEIINKFSGPVRFKDSWEQLRKTWLDLPEKKKKDFLANQRVIKLINSIKSEWNNCGDELIFQSSEHDMTFSKMIDHDLKVFAFALARS